MSFLVLPFHVFGGSLDGKLGVVLTETPTTSRGASFWSSGPRQSKVTESGGTAEGRLVALPSQRVSVQFKDSQ